MYMHYHDTMVSLKPWLLGVVVPSLGISNSDDMYVLVLVQVAHLSAHFPSAVMEVVHASSPLLLGAGGILCQPGMVLQLSSPVVPFSAVQVGCWTLSFLQNSSCRPRCRMLFLFQGPCASTSLCETMVASCIASLEGNILCRPGCRMNLFRHFSFCSFVFMFRCL